LLTAIFVQNDYIKNIKINSPLEPTNKPRDEVTEILNFDKTETDENLQNNEGNIEEVENENIDFGCFLPDFLSIFFNF
jgi:hypothetical protein